jgi:hypothetical protein
VSRNGRSHPTVMTRFGRLMQYTSVGHLVVAAGSSRALTTRKRPSRGLRDLPPPQFSLDAPASDPARIATLDRVTLADLCRRTAHLYGDEAPRR